MKQQFELDSEFYWNYLNRIRIILYECAREHTHAHLRRFYSFKSIYLRVCVIQWVLRWFDVILYYYVVYYVCFNRMMLDWNYDLRECTFELLLPFLRCIECWIQFWMKWTLLYFHVNRPRWFNALSGHNSFYIHRMGGLQLWLFQIVEFYSMCFLSMRFFFALHSIIIIEHLLGCRHTTE